MEYDDMIALYNSLTEENREILLAAMLELLEQQKDQ